MNAEIDMCRAKRNQINAFIKELEKQDKLLAEFDESLWCSILSVMIVKSDKEVIFKFKDETELPWGLENE